MAIEIKIQGEPEEMALLIRLLDRNIAMVQPLMVQAIKKQGAVEVGKALADAHTGVVASRSLEPINWPRKRTTKVRGGKPILQPWTFEQVRQVLALASLDWSMEKTSFAQQALEAHGAKLLRDVPPHLYDALVAYAQVEVEKARTRILQEVKSE